jgi:hypothetical protein
MILSWGVCGRAARIAREAVGFPVDGEDFGVMDEAVDQGDDAGGVWEHVALFGEGAIVVMFS